MGIGQDRSTDLLSRISETETDAGLLRSQNLLEIIHVGNLIAIYEDAEEFQKPSGMHKMHNFLITFGS